jgi:biopolymer transport protein ExbB
MKRFLTLAVCLLMLPLSAQAWWDEAWTIRKKITLDTQAAGIATEATGVPVLVRLSTGNFDFLAANENASDLRFVAEDEKTVLPHHIERFDSTNELAFVWVQVPRLAGSNAAQHIWLYYGNEAAQPVAATGLYDASQWAVYHLGEASGLPQDSAGAGHHVLGDATLQAATGFTFSAWIKPERADGELLAFGGLTLSLRGGVPVLGVAAATAPGGAPLALGAWRHIAVSAGSNTVLYIDGKVATSLPAAFAPAGALRIGGGLVGEIDEAQVSTVQRTEAWIATQADSQGQAGRLVRMGQEETTDTSGETGYFVATMNNLTVDGWVVTIICVLMLFVAIYVIAAKALLLSRVEKSNPRFGEAFDRLSASLRSLDAGAQEHARQLDTLTAPAEQFHHSPLHRIYQVGARELKSRFHLGDPKAPVVEHDGVTAPSVSERAMLAVRAALDAQMTRERQRLDRGMVLLTIAISGGPFLGLLGTVVGVMITFAAIAAAGDVNVNAIAPGIAAALVATVAGLGVAIPALFGYNYLQTKIKALSNDMTVFVDEFVTKMAETYGD